MKTLKSNSLTALLDAKHVSYEMIPHRHTETAAAEARAIRVDPDRRRGDDGSIERDLEGGLGRGVDEHEADPVTG